jgi:voltage-gated potassium channel
MKFLSSQIAYFWQNRTSKRNVKFLVIFIALLIFIITLYSVLFHFIMAYEHQEHSWITGFYWSLTVMSTLGFGDITFQSDLGRAFSILVLMTGIILLLVLLPFTFIQFFYSPWIEAQNKSRSPKELPPETKNHVILTSFNDITQSLIYKFNSYKINYVIVIDDLNKALDLYDLDYKVAYGVIDDPATYRNMRVENARMVFSSSTDEINTNIAFTVRELTKDVAIVTTADSHDSLDILKLAGSSLVLEPRKMIGEAFARRVLGGNASATFIGEFENLYIAEAPAMGTPMIGKTLQELQLRNKIGINVIGFWDHGVFIESDPNYIISNSTVLVMIGKKESIELYNELFIIFNINDRPVIIIGSGRVGYYAAKALDKRGIAYTLVEKNIENILMPDKTIHGNAADIRTLKKAGIMEAPSVLISTSDDDINIYLTIYCRQLRPDIQIISRANADKNTSTLHRAGADIIMSYPSLTANSVFNFLRQNKIMMLSEGIDIFTTEIPDKLLGRNLKNSNIRQETGCNIIAIKQNEEMIVNPDPDMPFTKGTSLLVLGTKESEAVFRDKYFGG